MATAAGADVLLSGRVSEKRKNVLTGDKVQTWAVSPHLIPQRYATRKLIIALLIIGIFSPLQEKSRNGKKLALN